MPALALAAAVAFASPAGAATYTNSDALGPDPQASSAVTVAGETGTVSGVQVTLNDAGVDDGEDLDVLLVGPAGERALVVADSCAGGSFQGAQLTFDSAAGAQVQDNCTVNNASATFAPTDKPPADTFDAPAPAGPYPLGFGAFAGAAPNGTWTLFVVDDTGSDAGSSIFIGGGWTLGITTATAPVTPATPTPANPATPAAKCPKGKKPKTIKGKRKCVKKKKKKK